MTKVRWNQLSEVDKERMRTAGVLNGCGAKGSWVDPPDWLFEASCDQHDFNYWLGGDEAARRKADWQFYQAMVEDANKASWWRRPFARMRAWAYYRAVAWWGRPYFHHGRERTLEDLLDALRQAGA